ncbi:hypothetical protein [Burkholderia singularis]|uniref:hypothetical protein n=1 Tax=Burkholderia singularis TaxID=1503053 RepID=UPI000B78557A
MVPAGRLRLGRRTRRSRRACEKPIGQHGWIVAQRVSPKGHERQVEPKAEIAARDPLSVPVRRVRCSIISH